MKALLAFYGAAWFFLAFSSHAQDDVSYLQYAEGPYAARPFIYPSDVDLGTVRQLVDAVESQTEERVGSVRYETDATGELIPNRLGVYTCSQADACGGGLFVRFEKRDGQWIQLDKRPGFWVA